MYTKKNQLNRRTKSSFCMKKQKQARSLHYQFNNLEEQHKIKTNITIPKFHYSSIQAVQQKARS
jgi:hypothetical protein